MMVRVRQEESWKVVATPIYLWRPQSHNGACVCIRGNSILYSWEYSDRLYAIHPIHRIFTFTNRASYAVIVTRAQHPGPNNN